ncbi:hypothetical protein ASC97_04065 [Rhizobium sp. Root1203]|uniref:ASCH domain-containing protein n=1 Tax=Rhizobium sp. Root1203 TaxID=1736427 RepID=UPI00070E16CA|nr:ASCH domain-containing protein [Rhizobium sp. Root1203]KQV27564.1 hypothetical protein ASC97_04065 [Rhizobium sp. Root1203]
MNIICTLQESELPALALSVRQPWAHAIVRGWKDIENRQWNTNQRGRVCIHASAFINRNFEEDSESYREVLNDCVGATPMSYMSRVDQEDVRFGAIIGVATIVDVVRCHDSPWFFGRYGFVLEDQQYLPTPVTVKGALGFFDWRQRLQGRAERTITHPAQRSLL